MFNTWQWVVVVDASGWCVVQERELRRLLQREVRAAERDAESRRTATVQAAALTAELERQQRAQEEEDGRKGEGQHDAAAALTPHCCTDRPPGGSSSGGGGVTPVFRRPLAPVKRRVSTQTTESAVRASHKRRLFVQAVCRTQGAGGSQGTGGSQGEERAPVSSQGSARTPQPVGGGQGDVGRSSTPLDGRSPPRARDSHSGTRAIRISPRMRVNHSRTQSVSHSPRMRDDNNQTQSVSHSPQLRDDHSRSHSVSHSPRMRVSYSPRMRVGHSPQLQVGDSARSLQPADTQTSVSRDDPLSVPSRPSGRLHARRSPQAARSPWSLHSPQAARSPRSVRNTFVPRYVVRTGIGLHPSSRPPLPAPPSPARSEFDCHLLMAAGTTTRDGVGPVRRDRRDRRAVTPQRSPKRASNGWASASRFTVYEEPVAPPTSGERS